MSIKNNVESSKNNLRKSVKSQLKILREVLEQIRIFNELSNRAETINETQENQQQNNLVRNYESVDLWGKFLSFEQILKDLETEPKLHKLESAFIQAKETLLGHYDNHLNTLSILSKSIDSNSDSGKLSKSISANKIAKLLKKLEELYPVGGIDQYFDTLDL